MTLGVRGVVLDGDGKVFLVRHSYVAGWHLPGGGVEVGETFLEALRRELVEEGRIELTREPVLHGLFFNGQRLLPRPRRGLCRQEVSAGPLAEAQPRDRGVRVLCGRCAAGGDDPGHAAADRGSARWRGADCDVALGIAYASNPSVQIEGGAIRQKWHF